jgi:hypothetical protein
VGTIKLYGQMELVFYLFLPGMAISFYIALFAFCVGMACVYENTRDFGLDTLELILDLPRTEGTTIGMGFVESKAASRQLRSCQSLRTYIGSAYFFKKSTTITTVSLLINTTVYLLLA